MNEYNTIRATVRRAKQAGLGVTECAIRRWVRNDEIPYVKSGNRTYISWSSLLAYLGLSTDSSDGHPGICDGDAS
jgi:hypothetical protein